MKKVVLVSLLLCAAPALRAEPAQCDATAFTLKKPVQAGSKLAKPAEPQKEPKAAAPAMKPQAKKTTTRLISDCKDKKAKR